MFSTGNILRSAIVLTRKMENFHFMWREVLCSCQDSEAARDPRWRLVVGTKFGVWVVIRSSVVGYFHVRKKWWTVGRLGLNCPSIILPQRSFKWRKVFFISQWKHERSWSFFKYISTCYNVKYCFNILNHLKMLEAELAGYSQLGFAMLRSLVWNIN